jgi:hypothetical protein
MIKIQQHLGRPDADKYLDYLAGTMWKELNPIDIKTKKLKSSSLIEKCRKFINLNSDANYFKEIADGNKSKALRQKKLLRYFLTGRAKNLKRIITSRPSEFAAVKNEIFNIIDVSDVFTGTIYDPVQTPFGKVLSEKIFNYKAFRASPFCKKLLQDIGFGKTACPYCNFHGLDIITIESTSPLQDKILAYLDLDHFYPKSQNPFFALSFFNLIPSCHHCNEKDKGDKPFEIGTHIHPYVDSFDDYYEFKISLKALLGDAEDLLTIECKSVSTFDMSVNDLKLKSKYNHHLEAYKELVETFENYKYYIGTASENIFVQMMTRGVPLNSAEIIKTKEGKVKRDLLRQIDINGVLKIV